MNKLIIIILHLFYWLVFLLFSSMVSFRLIEGFTYLAQNLASFAYNLLWAMIQFYLFYFFVYRYIEKQKYIRYFVVSVAETIALSTIMYVLYTLLFNQQFNLMLALPTMAGTFIIGHTGSLLKGFVAWFCDIQLKREAEKLLLQTKLDALHAQLNPHFLFNTLNNIDSLIASKPEKASEALLTLSNIMRYMLYEARSERVKLSDEIQHYKNIIELQMLRLNEPSKVQFNTELNKPEVEIAPLLFLPFIENAFNYALFDGEGTAIDIAIKTTNNTVVFECKNRINPTKVKARSNAAGIGLGNLKKRLGLTYPSRHKLQITNDNLYFSAQLSIQL
ncbi:MAG: histidine kinase [Prolixibacteraceae bacterium]|nr:histidine kinase [Prolixibacteraceae bacterium]MBN2648591.1 histidine kinase [Prolixibacteraceae bacterium]